MSDDENPENPEDVAATERLRSPHARMIGNECHVAFPSGVTLVLKELPPLQFYSATNQDLSDNPRVNFERESRLIEQATVSFGGEAQTDRDWEMHPLHKRVSSREYGLISNIFARLHVPDEDDVASVKGMRVW